MKHFVYFIVIISILVSCCPNREKKQYNEFPLLMNFNLKNLVNSDSSVIIINSQSSGPVNSNENTFLRNINSVKAELLYNDAIVNSVSTSLFDISGIKSSKDFTSTNFFSKLFIKIPKDYNTEKISFKFIVKSADSYYMIEKKYSDIYINNLTIGSLLLNPFIDIMNDSNVVFGIDAFRSKFGEKEYLPTSEYIHIEILSQKGVILWSSDYNKNFLQVVSPLLPIEIADKHRYSLVWNGRKNDGSLLPPGKYQLRMIIPARPLPYSQFLQFNWKSGDD